MPARTIRLYFLSFLVLFSGVFLHFPFWAPAPVCGKMPLLKILSISSGLPGIIASEGISPADDIPVAKELDFQLNCTPAFATTRLNRFFTIFQFFFHFFFKLFCSI